MIKKILILSVALAFISCAPKLGPDPFEGVVTVRDVSDQITKEAEGDCNLENTIKQQLNLQLFQIAQQVCSDQAEEPVLFNLSEMVYCVFLATKHHELEPTACENSEEEDDQEDSQSSEE